MERRAATKEGGDEGGEEGVDLTMLRKKKAVLMVEGGEDAFAKKFEALNLDKEEGEEQEGNVKLEMGIWQHDDRRYIKYELLLGCLFYLLAQRNPDFTWGGIKKMKTLLPQCVREGPKKTIFANINEICERLKRADEYVSSYLFAELGMTGSTEGSQRLVIKGRFQPKQIKNVLRSYILGAVGS